MIKAFVHKPGAWLVACLTAVALMPTSKLPAAQSLVFQQSFGRDALGHSIFVRTQAAFLSSLALAICATAFASALALAFGLLSHNRNKAINWTYKYTVATLVSVPFVLVAGWLHAQFSPLGLVGLSLALGGFSWFSTSELLRVQLYRALSSEAATVSRLVGTDPLRRFLSHAGPSIARVYAVKLPQIFRGVILAEAALSYLHLGLPQDQPSLGLLVREGQEMWLSQPAAMIGPSLALMLLVYGVFDLSWPSADSKRTTRARSLGAAFLFLFLFAALILPRNDLSASLLAQTRRSLPEDTLFLAHESEPRGFDPHLFQDELSVAIIRLLHRGLYRIDSDLHLIPDLAEGAPQLSENGLELKIEVRPNLLFQNGRAVDAAAVVKSFRRLLHSETGSSAYSFFSSLDGLEEFRQTGDANSLGIVASSSREIVFRLKQKDPSFSWLLALSLSSIVDTESLSPNSQQARLGPIGAGDYRIAHDEPSVRTSLERRIDLERDFASNLVPFQKIVFDFGVDRSTSLLRYVQGELDMATQFSTSDWTWVKRQLSAGAVPAIGQMRHTQTLNVWGLAMNCEMPPFDNVHVRRAVAFAVNRGRWEQARLHRIAAMGQPVPAGVDGSLDSQQFGQRYDLSRARNEMALAEQDGRVEHKVLLWIAEGESSRMLANLAREDLQAIGLDVELRTSPTSLYFRSISARQTVQLHFGAWQMDIPDASNIFDVLFHSRSATETSATNRSFFRNEILDALLDRAREETDAELRKELYEEASRLVIDQAPWAFAFQNSRAELIAPRIRNYQPNALFGIDYSALEHERGASR